MYTQLLHCTEMQTANWKIVGLWHHACQQVTVFKVKSGNKIQNGFLVNKSICEMNGLGVVSSVDGSS